MVTSLAKGLEEVRSEHRSTAVCGTSQEGMSTHSYISVKLCHRYMSVLSQYNLILLPKQALISTLLPLPISAHCFLHPLHWHKQQHSHMLNLTKEMIWKKINLIRGKKKKKKKVSPRISCWTVAFSALMPTDVVVKQAWGLSHTRESAFLLALSLCASFMPAVGIRMFLTCTLTWS